MPLFYAFLIPSSHRHFSFNDAATPETYTLSLHDALPISRRSKQDCAFRRRSRRWSGTDTSKLDRKSTRLNSSHTVISYAVFCLKKKSALQEGNVAPAEHRPARFFGGLRPGTVARNHAGQV